MDGSESPDFFLWQPVFVGYWHKRRKANIDYLQPKTHMTALAEAFIESDMTVKGTK